MTQRRELISLSELADKLNHTNRNDVSLEDGQYFFDCLCVILQGGGSINLLEVARCVDFLGDLTKHLFTKVDILETDLNEMKQKLNEMKQKLDRLEQLEANLLMGEIASRTEKEMVNYILKDCPDVNKSYITIHHLEKTLYSYGRRSLSTDLSEDQVMKAKQNWDDLDKRLKRLTEPLSYNVYEVIDHLKADRNRQAHPKFDVQTASDQVDKILSDPKVKDDCSKLLTIFHYLSSI